MKKMSFCQRSVLSLVGGVLMALSCSAGGLNGLGSSLQGLFGVKLGERVPRGVAVEPSDEGFLMTGFEPENPEVTFQSYIKMIVPETRKVCLILAVSEFASDARDEADTFFDRTVRVLDRRLDIVLEKDPTAGISEPEIPGVRTLRKSVYARGQKVIYLEMVSLSSGALYRVRLGLMDVDLARSSLDKAQKASAQVVPLEGLFGVRFNSVAARNYDPDKETKLADGTLVVLFEPERKFLQFQTYVQLCLPQSRRMFLVGALQDFDERFAASQCFDRAVPLLEKKFKITMVDNSSQFDSSKANASGERIFRSMKFVFPNTFRSIEIQMYANEDSNKFFVRLRAIDEAVKLRLGKETKAQSNDDEELKAL